MNDPDPTTMVLDTSKPTIARVYDASLGGKDNYEVDRKVWAEIQKAAPHQGAVSRMNRRWLIRVVRYLADEVGIDQFLDLGSGLPTAENTHQVAQYHDPEVRVVYVDIDPVCNVHGRALLAENEHTHFVQGDFTKPAEVLAHPEITGALDFDRPIVLMQCGTLHHVPDEQDPVGVMRRYIDALAPGSHVMISHFWDPGDENPELHRLAREVEEGMRNLGSGWWRSREDIQAMFDDLEMLPPGLVELEDWWPLGPRVREMYPEQHLILGGVGRKA
ncbi:S-adenosyl methyltransferase [Amycolatopsis arida]|uniref:S-adenosyl methyltransferase n=1 Tax=Amycolatopsis arida TaxID=587909 RepID=A0A1I5LBZ4_9PSEU|nr:SAM-dependent methyltransferase [Amycolatopsis arida]TDX93663.1 S-adenosyl methyltransferase [Amycolatopsis arida]SFO94702.1 S-adenosyl methyltransferase [Amycolatopsis arida]